MNSSDKRTGLLLRQYSLIACAILAIIHLVGMIGLHSSQYHHLFELAASLNLILSFLFIAIAHRPFEHRILIFALFAFIIGMIAEITGVHTGYPFGIYYYTSLFGPQVLQVPIIIGLNWILLNYVVAMTLGRYLEATWVKILCGSVLMVLVDILLEHFAIRHHFWVWQTISPPAQNYLSWFLISFIIQVIFFKLVRASANTIAAYYLAILILFLAGDWGLSLWYRTF